MTRQWNQIIIRIKMQPSWKQLSILLATLSGLALMIQFLKIVHVSVLEPRKNHAIKCADDMRKDVSGATSHVFLSNKKRSYNRQPLQPSILPPSPPKSTPCESMWGVVTTINKPTDAIKAFIRQKKADWCMVIVSDKSTPESFYEV